MKLLSSFIEALVDIEALVILKLIFFVILKLILKLLSSFKTKSQNSKQMI